MTPFGVDVQEFSPRSSLPKMNDTLYVGTIKPIETKYGIVHIIEAAELLHENRPDLKIKYLLIGDGKDLDAYREIIAGKKLSHLFEITGRIPFSEISKYHNLLDVFLNVSIDDSESFGVATVEAMACEKPVIVTDVGGLLEVVENGKYGFVIPRKDPAALAEAILKIAADPQSAKSMGKRAREHVLEKYDWEKNLGLMHELYLKAIKRA